MHKIVDNLLSIQNGIKLKIKELNQQNFNPNIVAVCKTFSMNHISPLINHGHIHFGENKIQEALTKWTNIKQDFSQIKLHMIGKLQSNKVKFALSLFDYIHSLDNLKLAEKIAKEELKQNKKIKIFIQVNIGEEEQKNGVFPNKLESFYKICSQDLGLNIIGLMCLPPINKNVESYFAKMLNLRNTVDLPDLSMGMSEDYLNALNYQANYLRIGSKIFGNRS